MMSVDFSQIMNIILAIFAFGTLITAILTFRQTKEFEKQRIRPMMQAHLRMAEDPFSCAELVISNPGQTIAHNVKFEFIPNLPKPPPEKTTAPTKTPAWHQNPLDIIRQRLLGEPIQTWVPGYEITVLFWFPTKTANSTSPQKESPPKPQSKSATPTATKNQPTTATSSNSTPYYSLAPRNPKPQYTESKQTYKTFTKN